MDMKRYKTAALLLLCLLCALTLSACYTDADPWPASPSAGHAPAAAEGTATDGQWNFPDAGTDAGAGATAAPADTHELDTGSDPGLNG